MSKELKALADDIERQLFGPIVAVDRNDAKIVIRALRRSSQSTSDAGGGVREDMADWSDLPKDIYVIGAQRVDAFVCDVKCCSVPMMNVPEVRYVRSDTISNPAAADSNASAEARFIPSVSEFIEKMAMDWVGKKWRKTFREDCEQLVKVAHASDCEKQGESDPIERHLTERNRKDTLARAGIPSDRPADVTVDELAEFLACREPNSKALARALLRAFTVGRR